MRFLKLIDLLTPYFCIFFLSFFIYKFGINDLEDYGHGLLTARIYWENLSNLFISYYDYYGPGVRLPIGNAPFFHPLNFLLYDLKLYYTFFVAIHLLIQFLYTKKIFLILKIEHKNFILGIILIFCLPNLNYIISDDWIGAFFSYCLFPSIFYYTIKIINKQKFSDYYKITLLTVFWIINGHTGIIATYIIFLFSYFLISFKNYENLKNIFNKYFLFSFVFLILILSDHLYFLINELSNSNSEKHIQSAYSKRPFIEIFLPFENFLSWTQLNRLPGNPILIYSSLLISGHVIYKYIKKKYLINKKDIFFIKNFYNNLTNDLNLKLSFLFLLFLFLSISDFFKYIYFISGIWINRDIFLFVGLLLIFNYFKEFDIRKKIIIFFPIIFYTFLFLLININSIYLKKENNFILNNVSDSEFITKLKNLNINKKNYYRLYLSKGLYPFILKGYENDGIYSNTDLIKYNFAPFNGWFKNNNIEGFGDQKYLLSGWIDSHFNLVNNEFFLDLYRIKYLLITKKEISNLKNKNFKIITTINTNKKILDKEVKILESLNINIDRENDENEKLILLERNIQNYAIDDKQIENFKKNILMCKKKKLQCILDNKKNFEISKHRFLRIDNASYIIKNYNSGKYIFMPFVYDKNWISDKGKFNTFDGFGIFFSDESKNSNNYNYHIKYTDNKRFLLRIIFFISLLIYIFSFYIFKKFFINFHR